MISYTANVREENARWLAGSDSILAGTSLRATDNGDGTVTLGQDVVDYLRTLPEHYDGVVSGEVIYIAGDGYDLVPVPGTDAAIRVREILDELNDRGASAWDEFVYTLPEYDEAKTATVYQSAGGAFVALDTIFRYDIEDGWHFQQYVAHVPGAGDEHWPATYPTDDESEG